MNKERQLLSAQNKRWLNPTFQSTIFQNEEESAQGTVVPPARQTRDLSREELFGVHKDEETSKNHVNRNDKVSSSQSGAQDKTRNQNKLQREKNLLPYNAMWWDLSSMSQQRTDAPAHIRQKSQQQSQIFVKANQDACKEQLHDSNSQEIKQNENNCDDKLFTFQEKKASKDNNRNRADVSAQERRVSRKPKKIGEMDLLAATASQFEFDSRRYDARGGIKNEQLNLKDRVMMNRTSTLDNKQSESINKKKSDALTNEKMDILIDKLHHQVQKKQPFILKIGNTENIWAIEYKSRPASFNLSSFAIFAKGAGYHLLASNKETNGKFTGTLYLKQDREYAQPIEALAQHLKLNGLGITCLTSLNSAEFNARKIAAPPRKPAKMLDEGRKHFKPSSLALNIFENHVY